MTRSSSSPRGGASSSRFCCGKEIPERETKLLSHQPICPSSHILSWKLIEQEVHRRDALEGRRHGRRSMTRSSSSPRGETISSRFRCGKEIPE